MILETKTCLLDVLNATGVSMFLAGRARKYICVFKHMYTHSSASIFIYNYLYL